jgi:hypothetical protein
MPTYSSASAGLTTTDDELVARLLAWRGTFRLALRADRVPAAGRLAFATAQRVVDGVRGAPRTDGRLPSNAADPPAPADVGLSALPDLTDGRAAQRTSTLRISPEGIRNWA